MLHGRVAKSQRRRSASEVASGARAKQSEASAKPKQIKEPETSSLGEIKKGAQTPDRDGVRPDLTAISFCCFEQVNLMF